MAVFNPQIQPTQDPNFTNVTKPVPAPKADISTGLTLATVGEGIEGAAKLADTTFKGVLKDTIQQGVDNLQGGYLDSLKTAWNAQRSGIPINPATLAPVDDQGSNGPPPPAQLQAGLAQAQKIGIAQIQNSGKANDTLYTGALYSMAKNLRAQYPGYRDYIDEQIKQVSGKDPANAFMQNLLTDINQNGTNARSEHDKITTLIRDNLKLPNADIIASQWDRGAVSADQVYSWVHKYAGSDYQRQSEVADRANNKGRLEDVQTAEKMSWSRYAGSTVQSAIDTINIAGGTQTAQGLVDFITQANQEGKKVDPLQLEQGLQGLQGLRENTRAQLLKQANAVGPDGRSASMILGSQAVNQEIEEQLKPIDHYIKWMSDEKLGFAHTALRQATALQEGAQRDLLTDKNVGTQMQTIAAVAKLAPQWGDAMFKAGLLNNLDKNFQTYYAERISKAVTQTDPSNPSTLKEDFQDAKKKGIPVSSRVYDSMLRIPAIISDPKAPDTVKLNAATYGFNPKNTGMLNELKMDYTDPQTKQFVPGKYAALTRLTSPDITDNLWSLRNKSGQGQQAWMNYKDWAENEFGTVYREDIQNLFRGSTLPTGGGVGQGTQPLGGTLVTNAPKFHIAWDSDNNRFIPLDQKGRTFGSYGADTTDNQTKIAINTIINRVNGGLANLSNISKKEGGNVGAYLIRVLDTVDPNMAAITMPMRQAIINSNNKKLQSMEDTFFPQSK